MEISIIGAGGWGTALATVIANNNYQVKLWVREKKVLEQIKSKRENVKFLQGVAIPNQVNPTGSLQDAVVNAEIIIIAVPSKYMREISRHISRYINKEIIIVSAAKGIEQGTFKRMSQVIKDEISGSKVVVLSGPTHAEEVGRQKLTSAVLASDDNPSIDLVKKILNCDYLKLKKSDDVAGVEIGGSVKNIISIALGMCDGLGLGDNAKAAVVSKGYSELVKIGSMIGGKLETFLGLSGIGDLIVTSTSKHSRNRLFGELVSKGTPQEEIEARLNGMVVEGKETVNAVYAYCNKNNLDLPLIKSIYNIIYNNTSAEELKKLV